MQKLLPQPDQQIELPSLFCSYILQPLLLLYLHGPSYIGWHGKSYCDICAEITGYSSDFWRDHPAECEEIIWKEFESFYIFLFTLVYFGSVIYGLRCLLGMAKRLVVYYFFEKQNAVD